MADPDAPWEIDIEEEPPAPEAPSGGEAAAADAPPEDFPPPPEELTEAQLKKKYQCRHWVRPKFLQYTYIYNYRKNYYDDYIDFLDKRNRGVNTDVPRAQTWAERALRTYTRNIDRTHDYIQRARDRELLERIHYVNTFHALHSKDYYSRKYYKILY